MTPEVVVSCRALRPDARLPERATAGSAGFDLHACLTEPMTLLPGQRALVPTGLILAIPEGFEGTVRPRSGLALRHGIGLVNSPGTIDSDYRGEVGVIVINWGEAPFLVHPGDRIAQILIQPVVRARMAWGETPDTARGAGGFGHTGTAPLPEPGPDHPR